MAMRIGLLVALIVVCMVWIPDSRSKTNVKRPLKVAHRGGAGLAPENTLAAFRKALELKADAVELDLHMSKDGVLVVIHDPDVDNTTDGIGDISSLTLAELKTLNAAAKFKGQRVEPQRIPTLEEVLALVQGRTGVQIEIKRRANETRYAGIEAKVLDAVRRYNMLDEVVVISFDFPTLQDIKVLQFDNLNETVQATLDGMAFAAQHGATTVSCTGMIPASTNGLLAVQEAMETGGFSQQFPTLQLTTGHETVVAAFVLNVEQMCHTTGRDFQKEHVTCVGLGHIGTAVLELLLRLDYRPRSLHLVDVTTKEDMLRAWQQKLVQQYNYQGNVEIIMVSAASGLPGHLYDKTTFILGATSSPHVIDIDRLQPGTLIVDDSFPLGFDTTKAMQRIQHQQDILITIAGALAGPHEVTNSPSHITGDPVTDAIFSQVKRAANVDPFSLTGCVYSSVLSKHFDLPWRLGKVNPDDALRHYICYKNHAFHGTSIYIIDLTPDSSGVYFLGAEVLEHFRQHYSTTPL